MSENLSSLLICVFMKSGKSRDDFYVVHPTSCTISLSANIQFSLLTREHFPHTIEHWWRFFDENKIFPSVNFFFHRKITDKSEHLNKLLFLYVFEWKTFSFQWKFAFPRKLFKNGTWVDGCGLRNRHPHWSLTQRRNIYRPIKIVSRIAECLSQKNVWCWLAVHAIRIKVHFFAICYSRHPRNITRSCAFYLRLYLFFFPLGVTRAYNNMMMIKKQWKSSEKLFQFIKRRIWKEEKTHLGYYVESKHIFYALWKIIVRDKRVIVDAIDFFVCSSSY